MTAFDILVILLLGGGAILGFLRGFVQEVISLFAWVCGIVALKFGHSPVSDWLVEPVGTVAGAAALAFGLLFLPTFIAVKLLARALGKRTRRSLVGPVDRLLGGGFGILKGLIIATILYLIANLATDTLYGIDAPRPDWMRNSQTHSLMDATSAAVVDWVDEQRESGLL